MKVFKYPLRAVVTFAIVIVAFGVAATAQTFSLLYNFGTNPGDPTNPYAPCAVVQGPDGNLYGTTPSGGTSNNGTVFKITPAGTLTVLYDFDITHGEYPFSGLTLGTDGNFYGTTVFGGTSTNGIVFKITRNGALTILHKFTGMTDGAYPYAPPVQAADGSFYGTTSKGA